jgi:hypothetical protein
MSKLITTAYYDRRAVQNVNGLFTIKTTLDDAIVEEFSKLPARSGQNGFLDSWTTAKSPIPFSNELISDLYIWLDGQKQIGQWPTGGQIGEFWNISTDDDRVTIRGKNGKIRKVIGAHPENAYAGSAGCVVLLHETEEQKQRILAVRDYLKQLHEVRKIEKIRLIVL